MSRINNAENNESNGSEIVGEAYRELKILLKAYAEAEYPVLLIGESGTGKEWLARHYMKHTGRKGMTITCAGKSGDILASELFGHEKGAFTGANKKRMGIIRANKGGVIFLDEIGDADDNFQASLLRVSEYKDLRPVGSDKSVEKEDIDVLFIAATNRPENIRHDLKSRFRPVYVPPLQKFDIPALANHFLKGYPTKEIMDDLIEREYPCNIRDLEAVCEHIKITSPKIVGKPNSDDHAVVGTFSYERYKREIELWNKYIKPVFHVLNKKGYKYQYTPSKDPIHYRCVCESDYINYMVLKNDPKEDNVEKNLWEDNPSIEPHKIEPYAKMCIHYKVYEDIDINQAKEFFYYLDKVMCQGDLPCFLEILRRMSKYFDLERKKIHESDKNFSHVFETMRIELGKALKISNQKEAMAIMQRSHAGYHLAQNEGNKTKTAEALKISRNKLSRILNYMPNK